MPPRQIGSSATAAGSVSAAIASPSSAFACRSQSLSDFGGSIFLDFDAAPSKNGTTSRSFARVAAT